MKAGVEMLFGIYIDEHVLFKASLVLLCILSLFFILISILAVWLRNIQRHIVCLTKNTCSLPLVISNFEENNTWTHLVGSSAQGPSSSDGDGPRSDIPQETAFENSLLQGNEAKSVHGSNTQEEAIASYNNDASNVQNGDDSSEAHYTTSNDSERNTKGDKLKKDYMSLKGAKDHMYAKRVADSSQVESKMGCDERQNGKVSNEEKNKDINEDDHVDDLEEYDYPSSQCVGKLTTFGHNVEFQQTQPGFTKNSDVDDSGYLIVKHVESSASGKAGTSIPVGPFQPGGTSEDDGLVIATQGDDDNYDYIRTKDWTGPVDNSDTTTDKDKNAINSSAEDNHGYLTVVHETEVNSSKEQEHSTDQIYSTVHDSNNNNSAGVQSGVFYVNQNVFQSLGVECADDVPIYANNDGPYQTSMCNDNPAFCNVDESPLYDNP